MQDLGLKFPNYVSTLSLLESKGAIGELQLRHDGSLVTGVRVLISPKAVFLAREIEKKENEKKPLDERFKTWAERHPVVGLGKIVVWVLLGLSTAGGAIAGALAFFKAPAP